MSAYKAKDVKKIDPLLQSNIMGIIEMLVASFHFKPRPKCP